MRLDERTIVITGAAGGLGQVLVRDLAAQNARLALIGREADKLDQLAASLGLGPAQALAFPADLLQPQVAQAAAAAAAERFGRLDALLHLIGGWTGGKTLLETPDGDLQHMLEQHVWSSFNAARAFAPHLARSGAGRIIMITSPFAAQPRPRGGAYAIAKAGQETLALTMAQELRDSGVTVNLLQVKTIDLQRARVNTASPENAAWTTPEELSAAVQYLLSDQAGAVNGAKIPLYHGV
ncbi:MAG: SDR family NAD(P)-dependent oxidoreductase [Chloroflexota bacterium]